MIIRAAENERIIQQKFIDRFTLTYDQFLQKQKVQHASETRSTEESVYASLLIWDKLNTEFDRIDFKKALSMLKSIEGPVYLMPDPGERGSYYLTVDGTKRKDSVASAEANELAEQIEYEWYQSWKAAAMNMRLNDDVLPEDLYVFDKEMEHVIIFTHEYDFWELEATEEYMKCADSRFCLVYGFSGK